MKISSFHPLFPSTFKMSTFHLLVQQKQLFKGRALEKAELQTGSCEQERICLAKWPGSQSPKCDGNTQVQLVFSSTVRCSVQALQINTNLKTKHGQITVKAFGAMARGLEKAFIKRESRRKGTQQGNEGEQSRTVFQRRLMLTAAGQKSCTLIIHSRCPV